MKRTRSWCCCFFCPSCFPPCHSRHSHSGAFGRRVEELLTLATASWLDPAAAFWCLIGCKLGIVQRWGAWTRAWRLVHQRAECGRSLQQERQGGVFFLDPSSHLYVKWFQCLYFGERETVKMKRRSWRKMKRRRKRRRTSEAGVHLFCSLCLSLVLPPSVHSAQLFFQLLSLWRWSDYFSVAPVETESYGTWKRRFV